MLSNRILVRNKDLASARVFLHLLGAYNQTLARAPGEQRNAGMDSQNFQNLPGLFEKARCYENQA